MLISCPNCKSVYNISADRIPADGKKFKCSECGHIWVVYPQDLKDIEPDTNKVKPQIAASSSLNKKEEDTLREMFNRLSEDTKGLFTNSSTEDELPWERFKRKLKFFFSPIILIYLSSLVIHFLIASNPSTRIAPSFTYSP